MLTTRKINAIAMVIIAAIVLCLFATSARADGYQIGDIVTFGTYEQDNNRQDGAEDIQWIVIDQRDDQIMLISKYCLDSKPYHNALEPISWEYCSLRKWLNEDFFDTAFTKEEQDCIMAVTNENPEHERAQTSSGRSTIDRVFILSREESQELFTTYASRKAAPTNYAVARGAYKNKNNLMGWWWLRTTSYMLDHVTYVTSGGDVSSSGREVTRQDAGVRPVIWLNTTEGISKHDNQTDTVDSYWNEMLSYGFSLGEGWSIVGDMELLEGQGYDGDLPKQDVEAHLSTSETITDMDASNDQSGEVAMVDVRRTDDDTSEEGYASVLEKIISVFPGELELEDVDTDAGENTFLGEAHPWISFCGTRTDGYEIYGKIIIVKRGDYLLTFFAASLFQDSTDDILSRFYSVNA